MSTIPQRTTEQRMEALRRANDVRTNRALLKGKIKDGEVPVAEVLADPADYLNTMRVFDLLLAVPGFGRVKVNKLLGECAVPSGKRIANLTQRQQRDLVVRMRRPAVGRPRVY